MKFHRPTLLLGEIRESFSMAFTAIIAHKLRSALTLLGVLIGVVLGILGGNILAWVMKVPPAVPVDWIALGLALCSIVGIVFGTYPAWKAANLDPIESLRYE